MGRHPFILSRHFLIIKMAVICSKDFIFPENSNKRSTSAFRKRRLIPLHPIRFRVLPTLEKGERFSSPWRLFPAGGRQREVGRDLRKLFQTSKLIQTNLSSFFTDRVFLRRLIRSLKDRHSMVTCRLVQLRFEALFKEEERLLLVFIHENSC